MLIRKVTVLVRILSVGVIIINREERTNVEIVVYYESIKRKLKIRCI